MAEEAKKNITCPKCKKDASIADYEETGGRCPNTECNFNYQLYHDLGSVEEVRKAELAAAEKDKHAAAPKKKRFYL
jgi:hypothetical protein